MMTMRQDSKEIPLAYRQTHTTRRYGEARPDTLARLQAYETQQQGNSVPPNSKWGGGAKRNGQSREHPSIAWRGVRFVPMGIMQGFTKKTGGKIQSVVHISSPG